MYFRILYFLLWLLFFLPNLAYAGAGGTSGRGKGGGIIAIVIFILLLPFLIGMGIYSLLIYKKASKDAWQVVRDAAKTDLAWENHHLEKIVRDTFISIQRRWSKNDYEDSIPYLHPSYQKNYKAQMDEYKSQGLFNQMTDIRIDEVDMVLAKNFLDDDRDLFVAHITGTMNDRVVDDKGTLIRNQGDDKNSDSRTINEYWYFQRQGDSWLVRDITKERTALFDISLDEENWLGNKRKKHIRRACSNFGQYLQAREFNKAVYGWIAFLIGAVITLVGYAFYVWVGYKIFG